MSFKQHYPAWLAERLDETHRRDRVDRDHAGRRYFDVQIDVIERYETAVPLFREFLPATPARILESGCGTGRWMAYFEHLGHRSVGVDDSLEPLRIAREHDAGMCMVNGDAVASPFRADAFDAAFSSYVAEHFEEGPAELFREIHRVLRPGGTFFVVVPFDNLFRRVIVDPIVRFFTYRRRQGGLGVTFTEYRYTRREMRTLLETTGFEVLRIAPDDFNPPWSKGLFGDLCDVGSWFDYLPEPMYQLGPVGRAFDRLSRTISPWLTCGGVFCVARAVK